MNKASKKRRPNAISRVVRILSTVLIVSSVQEPKSSQGQGTKRLFTHFGRLNPGIQPLKYQHPTGQASQLYRNLSSTGEQLEEKTS